MTPGSDDAWPPSRFANVSGALLLGGASSRMGEDKAGLEWRGTAFATRTANLLGELFEEVLLVGGRPPRSTRGFPVSDVDGPQSSLRGVVSALEAASSDRVLIVATDLPRLNVELLLGLLAWPTAAVVLPEDDAGPQPLCALWDRAEALPLARARLSAGQLSLRGLVADLSCERLRGKDLAALDPEGVALTNVNTAAEFEALPG